MMRAGPDLVEPVPLWKEKGTAELFLCTRWGHNKAAIPKPGRELPREKSKAYWQPGLGLSKLQTCDNIHLYFGSHPIYSILFWQLKQAQ